MYSDLVVTFTTSKAPLTTWVVLFFIVDSLFELVGSVGRDSLIPTAMTKTSNIW